MYYANIGIKIGPMPCGTHDKFQRIDCYLLTAGIRYMLLFERSEKTDQTLHEVSLYLI